MRLRALLLVAALVGTAALLAGTAGTAVALDDGDLVSECAVEPDDAFSDPDAGNETIGWFDGYWYNESIDIDAEDGLTPAELDELSARAAARMEAMRCLTYEELPEIEIMDRDSFVEEQADMLTWNESTRQFDNAQFETMLTIGSGTDSTDVREESQGATVGGFYDFQQERIVIVSEDEESLTIDEPILAHELGHALQDQYFDLQEYNRSTNDLDKAVLGVIEGDMRRLELAYRERCEGGDWNASCVTDAGLDDGAGTEPPNWGYYFMQFQPYSDGPSFIEEVYEDGGWDAVNDLYEDTPNATSETIDPSAYGTVDPANLTVEDRSSADWDRLSWTSGPNHNVIGQAGMSAMLMGQSIEALMGGSTETVLDPLQIENGEVFDPFNFAYEETDGWRGDRLYAYTDDENRTASVWRTNWADEDEMTDFLDAYEELASYRGGERVDGYERTWTFGTGSDFDMAATLHTDGDELWIVTAPTTDGLSDIHEGIEPEEEEEANTTPPVDDGDDGDDTDADDDAGTPDDDDDDGGLLDTPLPGFGPLAALIAFAILSRYGSRRD